MRMVWNRLVKPGSDMLLTNLLVASDNIRQSVPVGPWRICDGSPRNSNWHEMQIKLLRHTLRPQMV